MFKNCCQLFNHFNTKRENTDYHNKYSMFEYGDELCFFIVDTVFQYYKNRLAPKLVWQKQNKNKTWTEAHVQPKWAKTVWCSVQNNITNCSLYIQIEEDMSRAARVRRKELEKLLKEIRVMQSYSNVWPGNDNVCHVMQ